MALERGTRLGPYVIDAPIGAGGMGQVSSVREGKPVAAGWVPLADGSRDVEEGQIEDVALPLYQGVMVRAFDPTAKAWMSGTGLRANWQTITFESKRWQPQFLMSEDTWRQSRTYTTRLRIGYREVARSTDVRSFIGAALPAFPCGHKVPVLRPERTTDESVLAACGLMDSFVFDWLIRVRLGAAALAWFLLEAVPLPAPGATWPELGAIAGLNLPHVCFAEQWLRLGLASRQRYPWRRHWSIQLATDSVSAVWSMRFVRNGSAFLAMTISGCCGRRTIRSPRSTIEMSREAST